MRPPRRGIVLERGLVVRSGGGRMPQPMRPPIGRRAWKPALPGKCPRAGMPVARCAARETSASASARTARRAIPACVPAFQPPMRAPRRGIVLERGLSVRSVGGEHGAARARAHWQAGLEARAPGEMPTGRDARGTLCCARNKRFRQCADGSESHPCLRSGVPAAHPPAAAGHCPGARTCSPQWGRSAWRGACARPLAGGLGSPRSRGNAHGQGCPWHAVLRAKQALPPARGRLGERSLPGVPAAQEPRASSAFHSTFKIQHWATQSPLRASAGVLFAFPPPLPRAKLSAAFCPLSPVPCYFAGHRQWRC